MVRSDQHIGRKGNEYIEGQSFTIAATIKEEEGGAAKNLSSSTVLFGIVDRFGDDEVIDESTSGVDVVVTDASAGEVEVRAESGVTDGMAGNWKYEIWVQDSATDEAPAVRGDFIIGERGAQDSNP